MHLVGSSTHLINVLLEVQQRHAYMYYYNSMPYLFDCSHGSTDLVGPELLYGFLDHRHTTLGRTPLYELAVNRRDLCLTTHNTQQETDFHGPGEIRARNSSKRAATGPRLRPCGHRDRLRLIKDL